MIIAHRAAAAAAAPLLLLVLSAPAAAAERVVHIGSFDRIRVMGPFVVTVVEGPPGATLSGDRGVIEGIDVRADGSTLTIRNGMRTWGERPQATATQPVVVTLSTRTVVNATMIGAGQLTIARMRGPRVDLTVTGAGTITARGIAADAANATIIGGGAITLAGTAHTARLLANGPAAIDASALSVGDLTVRVDGPGAIKAAARYTAKVTNVGLGQVTVAGQPKCTVASNAGGPVVCGAGD